jgi:predicted AAA+ superfamily ATPase
MWINRIISSKINKQFLLKPAILITGARQVGKSSLLKHLFPNADYVNFDRPSLASEAENNTASFLKRLKVPAILDEIQYVPALFRELKANLDDSTLNHSLYLLTGSQRLSMMRGVTESLAGRVAIFELDSLSAEELRAKKLDVSALPQRGGYPELWVNPTQDTQQFFDDYITTYLERDVRSIIQIESLRNFDRFIRSLALRVGALVNYSDIAKDIGVSAHTIKSWISVLEATGIVYQLDPYYSNRNKRLVKTPKLFFCDNGLLCHLLKIFDPVEWTSHVLSGKVWENFVFSELLRYARTHGLARSLYFWREKSGLEIDFLVEHANYVSLIEAKASENPQSNLMRFDLFERSHPKTKAQKIVACTTTQGAFTLPKNIKSMNPLMVGFDL